MGILLVRHAEAIPERSGLDDAARWLTELGRAQAREVAEAVRARGFTPTRVLTSPRVRAVQTAELFAAGLGFVGTIESLPSLSYTAPAPLAARELRAVEAGANARERSDDVEFEAVAAFGHMPTVAEIASELTDGQHYSALSLSEALWIEGGRVAWSVKPVRCR